MSPPNASTPRRTRASLSQARRVVVKIGSRLLADDLDGRVAMLAREARALRDRGLELCIVTSGAIALGVRRLGLSSRPTSLPGLQASAAVGQGQLIEKYQQVFDAQGLAVAQVLLTWDDVGDRKRYLNARLTLAELLALGAVPIINENDTISAEEIKFGDNDHLSALVAALVQADALVILTDVDGLYDGDPRQPGARLLDEINDIDAEARPVAGGTTRGGPGTGGMQSKVSAAEIAAHNGIATVVRSGRGQTPIQDVLAGATVGTVFWPSESPLQSRKHWVAFGLKPSGSVHVDAGARAALTEQGRSLLPSGVTRVEGAFEAGDMVRVVGPDGGEFARGLCAYSSGELERIRGRRSNDIAAVLGYRSIDEVIHRDDLVLLDPTPRT